MSASSPTVTPGHTAALLAIVGALASRWRGAHASGVPGPSAPAAPSPSAACPATGGAAADPLVRIHWVVLRTGLRGHGTAGLPRSRAAAQVDDLNARYHAHLYHWTQPVVGGGEDDGGNDGGDAGCFRLHWSRPADGTCGRGEAVPLADAAAALRDRLARGADGTQYWLEPA